MSQSVSRVLWAALALLGAFALGTVALRRGEPISALWIVAAAVCTSLVAFRFYGRFIADRVLRIDPSRPTPAVTRNDGLDFVPTDRHVLFGHHFAAIAGAGPLIGPVLAAQMGYLPGTLWLIAGVVFAGAVQDFVILFFSTRRDGRSLGEMVRTEMGPVAGNLAIFGTFAIMVILLAVLALIVVKALAMSPWGMFTVIATIPIALAMGVIMRFVRPGRILEVSLLGLGLLLASIWLGGHVAADPVWAPRFTFDGEQITWMLVGYGFVAAVLPVWLLLAPRDYLSTFLKVGTVVALAVGIFVLNPELKMPALTQFTNGDGPVWKGPLFPFLFITLACGAVSGFHALIASGTTPKLLATEADARYIGYGGMLMESFVAIMAMVAAAIIEPGIYFAMNAPAAIVGADAASAAATISSWGFFVTPEMIAATATDVGESTILGRAGGAPTLAVGIATIFHQLLPGTGTMAYWYHFAILFEALFILTAIDAGTRVGRFMLQDLLGQFVPSLRRTESWTANLLATAVCVGLWGYLLLQGVRDPLGGINTLWPLFGISNQMLAGIALMLATVLLFKMKRDRVAWVTAVPAAWLLVCTTVAALYKILDPDPAIGFLAQADRYAAAAIGGEVLAPAKDIAQMHLVVFNSWLNAGLSALFLGVMLGILACSLRAIARARRDAGRSDREAPAGVIGAVP